MAGSLNECFLHIQRLGGTSTSTLQEKWYLTGHQSVFSFLADFLPYISTFRGPVYDVSWINK
jgi:hypothetical protein